MIEAEAVIHAVQGAKCWVKAEPRSACGTCTQSCSSARWATRSTRQLLELDAPSGFELRPGDRVVLGIPEHGLLLGAVAVYFLPLLFLFAGAGLGHLIARAYLGLSPDWAGVLGGGVALLVYFGGLRSFRPFTDWRVKPVVLQKVPNPS